MADVSDEPTPEGTTVDTSAPTAAPAAVVDEETHSGEKVWRAGTLTYNKRGLVRLFGWLLWGDLAWSVRERFLGDVNMAFLNAFGASNSLAAFLRNTLPTILGLGLGPIVSYKSDRHRGPRGRRRPYLLVGVPLCALTILGMAASPAMGRALHPLFAHWWYSITGHTWEQNWSVLLVFAIFFAVFDVAAVLCGTAFAAFFNDVVPRNLMGRFWGMARAISMGVMIVFMLWIVGLAGQYYAYIYAAVGLIYGIGFMATVLVVKEGEYPPPSDEGGKNALAKLWRATVAYARECFSKPFYLWVFAASLLPNTLAFASIYTFSQWFATKGVGLTLGEYGKLTALYFILSLPLTPLQGWLADKIHPLRVVIIVLALHIPAALWGGFFIHDGRSFAIAFVITGLLQVLWGTATAALWPLLYPKDSYAQLSSAAGLISSVLSLVYLQWLGWFLDRTHNAYNYTFIFSGTLDILGLIATIVVYRKFIKLGGTKSYVAP